MVFFVHGVLDTSMAWVSGGEKRKGVMVQASSFSPQDHLKLVGGITHHSSLRSHGFLRICGLGGWI